MLVTSILNNVARQVSAERPGDWLGSLTEAQSEIKDDFLPDVIDDILQRLDLPGPVGKTYEVWGDGFEDLPLPSDFLRLQRDPLAVYERDNTRRRCIPISSDGEWEYLKEIGSAGAYRYYRLRGYEGARKIDFFRPLESGGKVVVNYISDKWIVNDGTEKAEFTAEADASMLPKRLVEAGIVYRFRERKGLPFEDKLAEYEAIFARFGNDRRGRRNIDMAKGTSIVGPFDIPVPDYIPES